MIERRRLLTLASLLLMADAPLRPLLLPQAQGGAMLLLPGGARLDIPPLRARLLAQLPFRAGPVHLLRFGLDGSGITQDVLALISPDARLLALERLSWQHAGANFITRFAMLPDREHLALERVALLPGAPQPRHESWTDYLLRDTAGLRDAPARPVLAGTLQASLSAERQRLAGWVAGRAGQVPQAVLAALQAAPFERG